MSSSADFAELRNMAAQSSYHILMFPWLAFGHMIPFLELSKKLAAKGITVSYISTPNNIHRLLPSVPSNLIPKLHLVEIPMPSVDGLPANCEATVDVLMSQIPFLKKAYDLLAEHFEPLLDLIRPDLIILDYAPYWLPDIAAKFGTPTAFFSVYNAHMLSFLGSPADLDPVMQRPSPDHAQALMSMTNTPDVSGVSSGQRLAKIIRGSCFVAVRSCGEFEAEYLSQIEEKYEKPVLPVGVLFPDLEQIKSGGSTSNTLEWLDRQKPKSVVFVAFGSEYKMSIAEIHELAFSLELCGLPFVWILRKPPGPDEESLDLLPDGFRERTLEQGIVIFDWVSQLEILAHPVIGGCLFHSGWGTIVESFGFGHPLILLPMVSDQGLNAKLLVKRELGYEVPRNEDGSFSREMVAESIRRVVVEPEGEVLRVNAARMKSVFGNLEVQESYLEKFTQHLEKNIGRHKPN